MSSYGVLLDIGSGSIGVAVVSSELSLKNPHLIYEKRFLLRVTETAEQQDMIRRVQESLVSAALALSPEGMQVLEQTKPGAKIGRLYVTCSSPWSYTVARNVKYVQETPFVVTDSNVTNLVESAEQEILAHIKETVHLTNGTYEVVENATVDVRVNEYPVRDPIKLTGTQLDLTHLVGVVPTDIITTIKEIQQKLFPGTELHVHTSMLVMYCTLRDIFPKMSSVCIVDITGEATEIGIVESNLLIENMFVPYGTHTFIRKIMQTTQKPQADIESAFHAYNEGTKDAASDFAMAADEYTLLTQQALEAIGSRRSIPQNFIINAPQAHAQYFIDMLSHVIRKTEGKEVHIVFIRPELVKEITGTDEGDTYLALLARFFHKLHGCGE